jgi:hypothetical protein
MSSENLKSEMVADAYRISTEPGHYMINPVFATSIRPETNIPGFSYAVGDDKDVTVENGLLGLDRPLSRYPVQAPPQKSAEPPRRSEPIQIPQAQFRPRQSQRGDQLRWGLVDDLPHHEPQCGGNIIFEEPVRGGLHTRMMARDSACQ